MTSPYKDAYQVLARIDRQIQALQSQAMDIMMRVPAPPGGRWPRDSELQDVTLAAAERMLKHKVIEAYRNGLEEGIRRYAWWKDSTQYVGTCGTTLEAALMDTEAEAAKWLTDSIRRSEMEALEAMRLLKETAP